MKLFRMAVAAIMAAGATDAVCGQPCEPRWSVRWAPSSLPFDSRAVLTVDLPDGPATIAGVDTGGLAFVQSVWRWTGASWQPIGEGARLNTFDLASRRVGDVVEIYAAGAADGVGRVLAWDGQRWAQLGDDFNATVRSIRIFDAGDGPQLYATGLFRTCGSRQVDSFCRWNGSAWERVGAGLDGPGYTLKVLDLGSGPMLGIGGSFRHSGGVAAGGLAAWDGASIRGLGGSGVSGTVLTMTARDGVLYVAGSFPAAGGVTVNGVASWDGESWSALGDGLSDDGFVSDLAWFTGADGAARLIAGGGFSFNSLRFLAAWDGSAWSHMGGPPDAAVRALATAADGRLIAVGAYSAIGDVPAWRSAGWDGTSWTGLGDPSGGADARVVDIEPWGEPGGVAVTGGFTHVDGVPADGVAAWDGRAWRQLGTGLPTGGAADLHRFDFGGGETLCAAGVRFVDTQHVARLTGTRWSPLGGALQNASLCCATFPSKDGELYIGGLFRGGSAVKRWAGSAWIDCGTLSFGGPGLPAVHALVTWNDSGDKLVAGGTFFDTESRRTVHVAAWDRAAWRPLGELNGEVRTLAVFNDGDGPALYAGGFFDGLFDAPGTIAGIAKWNGATWEALGDRATNGVDGHVHALAVFDDGTGPALYAGGSFTRAGGLESHSIARWDGSRWSPVAPGVSGEVHAMRSIEGRGRRSLWVGGVFVAAGGRQARSVAELVACTCVADWDMSGVVEATDFFGFIADFFAGVADIAEDHATDSRDFFEFVSVYLAGC